MYYVESKWSEKTGIERHLIYKRGEAKHIAIMYCGKQEVDLFLMVLNSIEEENVR
jgi:hypothetical protein